jgi:hypothetical protein
MSEDYGIAEVLQQLPAVSADLWRYNGDLGAMSSGDGGTGSRDRLAAHHEIWDDAGITDASDGGVTDGEDRVGLAVVVVKSHDAGTGSDDEASAVGGLPKLLEWDYAVALDPVEQG